MLTVRDMLPDCEVVVSSQQPQASPAVLRRVEEIWNAEKAIRGDALVNGCLFSVDTANSNRITGWLAEYKWFIAQRRDPALHADLQVNPLAVTGVLRSADGIVFGRRADHLEQDGGLWELVPSGGVDSSTRKSDGSVDLVGQVLVELVDEIGVDETSLTAAPRPFAIVHDSVSFVSDVGIVLSTRLSAASLMSTSATARTREHAVLKVVVESQLDSFVNDCGDKLAGPSRVLLNAARPLLKA